MALIYGDENHHGPAKLHALIIGVGHYPHFESGSPSTSQLPPLKQLESPPTSARMVARWLIDNLKAPLHERNLPLGSVELLISEKFSKVGETLTGTPATLENIKEAVLRWYKRCDADSQNIAFFYFCGHGFESKNILLLPSDFGGDGVNPWNHAIDFNLTYRGMGSCEAQGQYYVLDSCRLYHKHLFESPTSGVSLIQPSLVQKIRSTAQLFAAASGQMAFGDATGGPSRLTDALIKCLDGGGATKTGNDWSVNLVRLGQAVKILIDMGNLSVEEEWRQTVDPSIWEFSAGDKELHVLPPDKVPEVHVEMESVPTHAANTGEFYYVGLDPEIAPSAFDVAGRRGRTKLKAGTYHFGIRFPRETKYYKSTQNNYQWVCPPVHLAKIPVMRYGKQVN